MDNLVICGHFFILFWRSTFPGGGRGEIVEKVDLGSSRCDFNPQIGQFGPLEPFFLLSTFLPGNEMVEKVVHLNRT